MVEPKAGEREPKEKEKVGGGGERLMRKLRRERKRERKETKKGVDTDTGRECRASDQPLH